MSKGKPLIMVVDDETHILHVVSLKLSRAGFDVITAEDGEEGFDLAVDRLPDLVITDFQMPRKSGLELCMDLARHEPTSRIPALMLTARGFNLTEEQLASTNIVSVISKPFSPRDVLARVEELVGDRTVARASETL